MEKTTTLYCELMSKEQVVEFEKLMAECGIEPVERPVCYARNPTGWMIENRPREDGEDPMAAVIINLEHEYKQVRFSAGNRSISGKMIEPELMKAFLLTYLYTKSK